MQIIFLMGGQNFEKNREEYPLYLTEINEKLIIEKQIDYCLGLNPRKFLFCIKDEDIQNFQVDSVIKQLVPDSEIIVINNKTMGAVCTALLCVEHINSEEELILLAVDDFIEVSSENILNFFRKNGSDAGVVSFDSVHPRYSFAKLDESNLVIEVSEKKPISKNALVSFYYYKKGADFIDCAKNVIRKDNLINGSFYLSQTLNEMILEQKKVSIYKITNEKFHPLKTEMQLAQYISELMDVKDSK
ncbi:glycosyltransferase family 2 protein [uncultured Gilliamella sp.]|uniref:glycosyltransferase family 2 protein n=1 Tax=uncultured Gilliamella sp. TaxID=1193505 RepID=UPI0025D26CDD|nr:glycosyltransferase family 2 protein [uncultured Gilliamella sp.]